MTKWIVDNRVTENFKKELSKKGVIDVGGYRYVASEIFGKMVVNRIQITKLKELNAIGTTTILDYDFVDNENSDVFDDGDMHKI